MTRFDQTSAKCLVFTYKEGLLSPIAHDLKLGVTRFTIEIADEHKSVTAELDATSLRVLSALRDGREEPQLLSDSDRRKIESNIVGDVLEARRFAKIQFVSDEVRPENDGFLLVGRLTLHGQTRPLRMTTRLEAGRQVAEVLLHQPDFGIKPYSALLGTLRIRGDVKVRLEVPTTPL